jgi:hypothetical protein
MGLAALRNHAARICSFEIQSFCAIRFKPRPFVELGQRQRLHPAGERFDFSGLR